VQKFAIFPYGQYTDEINVVLNMYLVMRSKLAFRRNLLGCNSDFMKNYALLQLRSEWAKCYVALALRSACVEPRLSDWTRLHSAMGMNTRSGRVHSLP